jgi:hypothetical protein
MTVAADGTDALLRLLADTDTQSGSAASNDLLVRDLDLFTSEAVFPKMSDPHVRLRSGPATRRLLRDMIVSPTDDVTVLSRRQRWMLDREHLLKLSPPDDVIAAEADMLWAWRFLTDPDEDVRELHQSAYFSNWLIGKALNGSSALLASANIYRIFIAPVIGVLTPVAYVIVPYLVLRYRFKIRLPFADFLKTMYNIVIASMRVNRGLTLRQQLTRYASIGVSLVFYFQNVFSSVQVARMLHGVCSGVSQRSRAIRRFAAHTLESWEGLGGTPAWREATATCWPAEALAFCAPDISPAEKALCRDAVCAKSGIGCVDAMGALYGGDLAFFRGIVSREALGTVLRRAYVMDALGSIVRMRDAMSLTTVQYIDQQAPLLRLNGVWHPGVGPGSVANDWAFPAEPAARANALLTGPNAGGKSTLMKSVLLSVLMAQTLTFAPCRKGMLIRPFGRICSHINVPDSHERGESLFQAEMNRAMECIKALSRAREEGRTCLVVIDEIFSSTNPVEGIAGALATASKLGAFENAISIVSTHYTYLARLTHGPDARFAAFMMPVRLGASAPCPLADYKLRPGVSEQYVALEIMKAAGMDDDIVRDAISIKETILRGSRRIARNRARKAQKN